MKNVKIKNLATYLVMGLIVMGIMIVAGNVMIHTQTQGIAKQWEAFERGPAAKERLLSNLNEVMGYGGVIHQFKDYILKQDTKRIVDIQRTVRAATIDIIAYGSLDTTEKEKAALNIIASKIVEYSMAVGDVEKMILVGMTPKEIDKAIKIEDTQAVKAIKALETELNFVHENTVHVLYEDLESVSSFAMLVSAVAGGLVLLFVVMIASAFKRIVSTLNTAVDAANSISNGNLSMPITVDSTNETGMLLKSLKMMQCRLSTVIEKDIQTIVDGAAKGDLSQRIELNSKEGFYKELSRGINDVVDSSENIVTDTARVFGALADGDLNNTISRHYEGSFEVLKNDANTTVAKLKHVIEGELHDVIDGAKRGNLNSRVELTGKEGFFRDLGESVNILLNSVEETFSDVGRILKGVSEGDLTVKITKPYAGTFGQVKTNVNSTIDGLEGVVGEIRNSAQFIRDANEKVSSGNEDLARRTEQQSQALEKTAASMEQITSTVKNNADNSIRASDLAIKTREMAEDGGDIVNEAVSAMLDISQSSNKISDVIGVIDEIAFQTNLLALNASVEAARAGDRGRGFAVVATEVRNLAQRSAESAKEIKNLITDSVDKVEKGESLVNESGEALSGIVASVAELGDIIGEISIASSQQSVGIEGVNSSIIQIDSITQKNTALAEEASSSSQSSLNRATDMSKLVSFFNLPVRSR